jgi:hypothetical protein
MIILVHGHIRGELLGKHQRRLHIVGQLPNDDARIGYRLHMDPKALRALSLRHLRELGGHDLDRVPGPDLRDRPPPHLPGDPVREDGMEAGPVGGLDVKVRRLFRKVLQDALHVADVQVACGTRALGRVRVVLLQFQGGFAPRHDVALALQILQGVALVEIAVRVVELEERPVAVHQEDSDEDFAGGVVAELPVERLGKAGMEAPARATRRVRRGSHFCGGRGAHARQT